LADFSNKPLAFYRKVVFALGATDERGRGELDGWSRLRCE
jgi:hypothetical protein